MTLTGSFEATDAGQVIVGEANSWGQLSWVIIRVENGSITMNGQHYHIDTHRPHDYNPVTLHKGQSAAFYGYYFIVQGAGQDKYGSGSFEMMPLLPPLVLPQA